MDRRLLAMLLSGLLLVTGCWSRIEINDLGVVLGIGIDVAEERPLQLTLFFGRAGQQGGGTNRAQGSPIWVASREGENLSDALREIILASPRRVSLHHIQVMVISREYVERYGMRDVTDFLARHEQIRLTVRPLLSLGRADQVLTTQPKQGGLITDALVKSIRAKGGVDWRLKDFLVARVSDTHSSFMLAIDLREGLQLQQKPSTGTILHGAGLFFGDDLVRVLTSDQARRMQWLLRNPRDSTVTATCPGEDPAKTLSARVLSGKAHFRPRVVNGKVFVEVKIKGNLDLTRLECRFSIMKQEERGLLEAQLSRDLREGILELVEIFQKTGTDPVGFGKWVQLSNPAFFRANADRWAEIWPTAEVRVSTDLRIIQSGLLIRPVNETQEETER